MEGELDPLQSIITSHLESMKRLGDKDRGLVEESSSTLMSSIRDTSGVRKQVVDKALAALGITTPGEKKDGRENISGDEGSAGEDGAEGN